MDSAHVSPQRAPICVDVQLLEDLLNGSSACLGNKDIPRESCHIRESTATFTFNRGTSLQDIFHMQTTLGSYGEKDQIWSKRHMYFQ